MKSQKGITLISLTVYIIAMVMIIAIMSVVSNYFYTNIDSVTNAIDPLAEYMNFNTFFSDEVNHNNIKVLECEDNYIVFDNDVQYSFIKRNKGIYRNQVKICKDVENCTFLREIKNGKNMITVTIQIGTDNTKQVEYTLKN